MRFSQAKKDEAKFFLQKMKENRGDPEFRFYLSSFLSSSRSITWVLQKEYKNGDWSEEFLNWYGDPDSSSPERGTKLEEMRNGSLFKLFKELRNIAVKMRQPSSHDEIIVTNKGDASSKFVVTDDNGKKEYRVPGGATTTIECWPSATEISPPTRHADVAVVDTSTTNVKVRYYIDDPNIEGIPTSLLERPLCELAGEYLKRIDDMLSEWEEIINMESNTRE